MNLTQYALEKNRVTIVLLLLVLCGGLYAYYTLPRAEDPGFVWRTAYVATFLPGAAPARVEELVTDKLEKAIQEMPEIDYVKSKSSTGTSLIYVYIKDSYKDIRPVWDNLRRKVEEASLELPAGVNGPFVNDECGDTYGTILAVSGEGFSYAELKDVADELRNELLLLKDIAKVRIVGAQAERVFIEYQNARLAEYGISPAYLSYVLESRNIISPGGHIRSGRERYALEPSGSFESIEDIEQTVIRLPDSQELVYLKDLAQVSRGYIDPPQAKLRVSGQAGLGLAISLQEGGNILTLGNEVKQLVRRFEARYPIGIEFETIAFQATEVRRKVNTFVNNLLQAVGIVILVMIFTLGLRTGLVVAALIPMAILMSLMLMAVFRIGLDQVSLAALIIALGMLVDNAIVMSESIVVQMRNGKAPDRAALDSAKELQIPLLTSSLTTAAAFLPIYLAESPTGEYCIPIFTVVTMTLLCSWFLALSMTPMLCVKYLHPETVSNRKGAEYDSKFYRLYRRFLLFLLRHAVAALVGVVLIFALALQGFWLIPAIFFPPNDKVTFTAEFSFPTGTAIETTEEMVGQVEAFIQQELQADENRPEGITNYAAFIGESAPLFVFNAPINPNAPEYAMLICNATSLRDIHERLIPRLEGYVTEQFPEVLSKLAPLQLSVPIEYPIEVRITGPEAETLLAIAEGVKRRLEAVPGVKNVHDDWGLRSKKVLVDVDQARAYRAGLTSQDVALSLQAYLSGFTVSQYREAEQVIPIVMRSIAAERGDIEKLESHTIYSDTRRSSIPLKQAADIHTLWQPSKIMRRDRVKTVTVRAETAPGKAIGISYRIGRWLAKQQSSWDFGYRYELGGELEAAGKANMSIMVKFPIAGLIILMLMIVQFNSCRKTFIIFTTIPLGLIGVMIGLLLTGSSFGFMALLGLISLAGIVVNNAIVLLDRIQIEQEQHGRDPQTAIIEAAQRRLRPIVLTTLTTVCGLLPLWYGGGPLWESMAITIIFGLSFSTVLTLGVVLVLYALCFKVSFKGYRYGGPS